MSNPLGKRKRALEGVRVSRKRQEVESGSDVSEGSDSESGSEDGVLDAQEIFRRHFEAQFEALPEIPKPTPADDGVSDESEEGDEEKEEWRGISEDEGSGVVIVQHTSNGSSTAGMSREELRAFMVCDSRYSTWIED
jgi:hypothetical protein